VSRARRPHGVTLRPHAADDGYLTVPLLDAEAVATLRAEYDAVAPALAHGFHASSAHATREVARHVDQRLKALLTPRLRELVPDLEPFLAPFISKGVVEGAVVDIHQDWTYTDERVHRAVLVWVPLVDVDASN